jgi:hypothetical protein
MLKNNMIARSQRCVCRYCGSKLEIRAVVFCEYGGAGAELYCPKCGKIEYGTEPEIYKTAKAFVDDMEFNYYLNMEENKESYQMNIAKVCEILSFAAQRWHKLDHKGLAGDIQFHEEGE